jgi:hypothetical protein
MTTQEWGPIAAFIENTWKDDFDRDREDAYYLALNHLSADTVLSAVVALAGGRALSKPPVSAGGSYLPSAETIARECAAWDFIGTWTWARQQIGAWVAVIRGEVVRAEGMLRVRAEHYTVARREALEAVHPEHGPKLVALVESFGLAYIARHGWEGHSLHEGQHRWATLALDAAERSTDLITS